VIESLAHKFRWGNNVRIDNGDESKHEPFKNANRLSALMLGLRIQKIVADIIDQIADDLQLRQTRLTSWAMIWTVGR